MDGENKETKITSVEKERVKDPRRVEQEKKLASISREAKECKARDLAQREQQRLKEEVKADDAASEDSFSPYVFVISAIGIAVGGYYLLYLRRSGGGKDQLEEEPPKNTDQKEEPKKKPNLEKL